MTKRGWFFIDLFQVILFPLLIAILLALFLASDAPAQTCPPLSGCLAWVDNSTNEDGFSIERKLNAGPYVPLLQTVGANVLTFTDPTLQQDPMVDNVYCYRVQGFNTAGVSAYSNEDCKTISRAAPNGAPSGLKVTFNNATGELIIIGQGITVAPLR